MTNRPTMSQALLMGDWPDPTVLKDGDDYYMTHTSGHLRPGLLIWHSRDLRTWTPLTYAITEQEGSIWAPDLIKHNGRYYIYYPAVGERFSNWVTSADSIRGPWSKPQPIGVGHIDPGHIADDEGRRWVHLSGGHVVQMSDDGLRAITEPRKVYEGWPISDEWAIEGFYLESPKLNKRGQWYYLTSAEGGTQGPSTSHMIVSARSRTPVGPWENSPYNPIIRTYDRDERWWSKGHGTLVEGPGGQWFCVFHGILNGQRSLGRATLIEPIEWTDDGWYKAPDRWPSAWIPGRRPAMPASDDLTGPTLGMQWQFHRQFDPTRFSFDAGGLRLTARGVDPGSSEPMSITAIDSAYDVRVTVQPDAMATAGLMLLNSPNTYIALAISADGTVRRLQKGTRRYNDTQEPRVEGSAIELRIVNDRQDVRFYCRPAGTEPWRIMQPGLEIAAVGPTRPSLFAFGAGQALFRRFQYTPLPSARA